MKTFFVYIVASRKNGTLYIGVTSDLAKRIWQHKNKTIAGFTEKYSIDKLVYFEPCASATDAINREKQLKNWRRQWKVNQIEKNNPDWDDLSGSIGLDSETSSE